MVLIAAVGLAPGRAATGDDEVSAKDAAGHFRLWHRKRWTFPPFAAGRVVTESGLRNLTVHEAYDPKAGRWTTLAPMPQARGGHAAAVLGGRLWCFGGESFGDAGRAHDETFVYDPQTDRWEQGPAMPSPLHGLGAVAASGAIHLLGGAAEVGGRNTRPAHYIFRP